MIRRGILSAFLAALAVGCGSSAPDIGARLSGPTDVVAFRGVTVNDAAALRSYLAVASARGNELRLVDLASDRTVLGPAVVFPLSIPSAPRPVRLAATSLGDDQPQADLLVASSAGSATIELVLTWGPENRVVDVFDLGAETTVGTAPEVLALAAAPVPGAPGQARVLAALSGGRIAVITATRAEGGSIVLQRPAVVRDLGFDALDLAVVPSGAGAAARLWLFAATRDDLDPSPTAEVFGVAQIDIAGPPEAWAAIPLDARAPTRLVDGAEVAERVSDERPDVFLPPALRVYAVLDPSGCGLEFRMNCGLATLDPETRTLAADPAGQMDHRAPMAIPAVPLGLAITRQAASPAADVCTTEGARLPILPATGLRCTSAVAAVTSSDGFVYLYDLGRWGAINDTSIVRDAGRARAATVTISRPAVDVATDVAPRLGVYNNDDPATAPTFAPSPAAAFQVTPGFTPNERFHIGWQAALPQLAARGGVLGRLDDGRVFLAAQADTGRVDSAGQTVWALGPRLADPALGVRAAAEGQLGDIVLLITEGSATCGIDATGATPETRVAEVLPPDAARFPGGAVVLAPLTDGAGQPVPSCWEAAVPQPGNIAAVSFSILASEHVLFGDLLGYLGRPLRDVRYAPPQDERALGASAEDLAIARKLRRFYYPAEACDAATPCPELGDIDPLAAGPALSFRVGWVTTGGRTGPAPVRGEQMIVATASGVVPMSRKPISSGALPIGITPVDRSAFLGPGTGVRFYTAYQDDQVYVFSPSEALGPSFSIR